MAPPNKRMVTVYDADGNAYRVDNLNAIDMVVSLGYTYKPGKTFEPVDNAPHALKERSVDPQGARKAQAILDGVGSNGGSPVIDEPPAASEEEDEDEVVLDAAEDDAAEDEAAEEVIELPPTNLEAPRRGGRGKKV